MKIKDKISFKIIRELIIEGYIIDRPAANIILETEIISDELEKIDLHNGILRCQYIFDEGQIYTAVVASTDPAIFDVDVEGGQCRMIYKLFEKDIEIIKGENNGSTN